jgi:hypothetical protein
MRKYLFADSRHIMTDHREADEVRQTCAILMGIGTRDPNGIRIRDWKSSDSVVRADARQNIK